MVTLLLSLIFFLVTGSFLEQHFFFFFQISLPWCSLDHYIIFLEKLKRRNYGLRITFFDVIVVKRPKFERSKVANCCYPQVHHSYLDYEDVFLFIRLIWVVVWRNGFLRKWTFFCCSKNHEKIAHLINLAPKIFHTHFLVVGGQFVFNWFHIESMFTKALKDATISFLLKMLTILSITLFVYGR